MIDACAVTDSEITLTAPRGKQGDYKLPDYLVLTSRTERRTPHQEVRPAPIYYVQVQYMPVVEDAVQGILCCLGIM
jgi:hypothetical protein